jgi:hypothetical protein
MYFFIANIILQNDQNVYVFHKKSESIIWFITIDAFIFTNDLLANWSRFIELRCNAFFMFFEFIIALFAHELFSRRFVMLFFDSICREIDENSKKMFDFRRSFFFFDSDHFSFRKSDFRVRDRNRERCCWRIDDESKHVENDLRFVHEI